MARRQKTYPNTRMYLLQYFVKSCLELKVMVKKKTGPYYGSTKSDVSKAMLPLSPLSSYSQSGDKISTTGSVDNPLKHSHCHGNFYRMYFISRRFS